ncbi:MAG: UDP-N-acetylmuramate dehydrogenase [Chitinophagales bacterium]|jgi:UDP-N-acetylmuramate dehydrogenase|nr:UDP-N-acetylmuramate dehydrogenase [Chitinophagales bacterium]
MSWPTAHSIKALNGFQVPCNVERYYTIAKANQLLDIDFEESFFVLGQGTNTLFIEENIKSNILHMLETGINILDENDKEVYLEVKAGNSWPEFVEWTLYQNFYGLENLSLIPGSVGACPVQNIGAYGVEVMDLIHEVKGFSIPQGRFISIAHDACEFTYRNSIFKGKLKGKFIITSVVFRLNKTFSPNISYQPLRDYFKDSSGFTAQDLAQAVIEIRQSKLPNHKEIYNCGSFFQNPIVSKDKLNQMIDRYPEMPVYAFGDQYKLSAGYLIESCGLKGFTLGNVSTYHKQALVITHNGLGNGREIYEFSEYIIREVEKKFGVKLHREVNVVGNV